MRPDPASTHEPSNLLSEILHPRFSIRIPPSPPSPTLQNVPARIQSPTREINPALIPRERNLTARPPSHEPFPSHPPTSPSPPHMHTNYVIGSRSNGSAGPTAPPTSRKTAARPPGKERKPGSPHRYTGGTASFPLRCSDIDQSCPSYLISCEAATSESREPLLADGASVS